MIKMQSDLTYKLNSIEIQEKSIFFKFLTLLSNLQKSDSKNSKDKDGHWDSKSSNEKWNFPVSSLLHSFNLNPFNCKYAAMPISLVVYI